MLARDDPIHSEAGAWELSVKICLQQTHSSTNPSVLSVTMTTHPEGDRGHKKDPSLPQAVKDEYGSEDTNSAVQNGTKDPLYESSLSLSPLNSSF